MMATPKKPRKISFSSPGKTAWIDTSNATEIDTSNATEIDTSNAAEQDALIKKLAKRDALIRQTLNAKQFEKDEIEKMRSEIVEALKAYRANLTCKEMRGTKNALITDLKEITESIREVQARIERWPTGAMAELFEVLIENHGDDAGTVSDTLNGILETYEDAAWTAINNVTAQPDQTNPGKIARDNLIHDLARIYQSTDTEEGYNKETKSERQQDTIDFVERIFNALNEAKVLNEQLPKNLYKFLP